MVLIFLVVGAHASSISKKSLDLPYHNKDNTKSRLMNGALGGALWGFLLSTIANDKDLPTVPVSGYQVSDQH